jgi:hypothetical protein
MHVTPLLAITAILLLISGLVKARAMARVGMGVPILPLAEVAAAFVLLALAVAGPPTAPVGLGAILGAVLLLLGSSFRVGATLGRLRRARDLSEGARLRMYVEYLPPSKDPEASSGRSREGASGGPTPDRNAPTQPRHQRVQPSDPPGPGKPR